MITKSILLPCPPERAFALFTGRISDWWPPERRHTGDPKSVITLSEDGKFVERDAAGRQVALGAVRVRLLPADDDNESCILMQDIEGNEFDLD